MRALVSFLRCMQVERPITCGDGKSSERRRAQTADPREGQMSASISYQGNGVVLQRIYGEFSEMPGLHLTCKQAQRLWGLDEQTCKELLDSLVDAKYLCRRRHGSYTRMYDGPMPRPQL